MYAGDMATIVDWWRWIFIIASLHDFYFPAYFYNDIIQQQFF